MMERTPRILRSGANRTGMTVPAYLKSVLDGSDSMEQAAVRLKCTVTTLYRWKKKFLVEEMA